MVTLVINTAEVAATPAHDCGVWKYKVGESHAKEVRESLERLGFTVEEE